MSDNNGVDGYYIFASSIAALVTRTITHPMDTIKIRLQASTLNHNNTNKTTLFENLKTIIFPIQVGNNDKLNQLRTFTSLYRGLPVALLFSVPALSVYLSCYETTKQTLYNKYQIKKDAAVNHLVSGCIAEISAGLFFTPMEVMKNRLQTTNKAKQTSFLSLATHMLKYEGIRGFFRGYWMSLVVFIPHSATYFITYEKMKQWMIRDESSRVSPTLYMLCSSVAGITSCFISTPLDIIKTRWQISAAEHGKDFREGPISIAKHLIRYEGRNVLIRSLYANIAWGLPTTAISMTIFEVLKRNRYKFE
ncbi:mitochondrial carrier domain-containing protein [Cokeromyces recurvatus]|uniref:mitochondrial carrier domain-containing protein n=1 Tax=Cokeromyces recurvatus TaxID=90255 RepID=UPI00221E67A3|nr:mitochondrial carrier domain-containing protein [Cokeromyces recurvatus]KAI7903343.1 mitochondrial carrier domain-containing protein [Cokeromyces recurvatus]